MLFWKGTLQPPILAMYLLSKVNYHWKTFPEDNKINSNKFQNPQLFFVFFFFFKLSICYGHLHIFLLSLINTVFIYRQSHRGTKNILEHLEYLNYANIWKRTWRTQLLCTFYIAVMTANIWSLPDSETYNAASLVFWFSCIFMDILNYKCLLLLSVNVWCRQDNLLFSIFSSVTWISQFLVGFCLVSLFTIFTINLTLLSIDQAVTFYFTVISC